MGMETSTCNLVLRVGKCFYCFSLYSPERHKKEQTIKKLQFFLAIRMSVARASVVAMATFTATMVKNNARLLLPMYQPVISTTLIYTRYCTVDTLKSFYD